MARFVYLGPPDEQVTTNLHSMTGEWRTGEPRDIDDGASIEWLRRHPHWRELAEGDDAPPPPRPRGRPRRAA